MTPPTGVAAERLRAPLARAERLAQVAVAKRRCPQCGALITWLHGDVFACPVY